jgi:CubicO group peptidase (beta-lactamase class C family)
MRRSVFLLLAALSLCCPSMAQGLQQALESIANQRGCIGISVVTTCADQVLQVAHTGQRDLAAALPVNDDTRYRVASISKLVTAIGLMRLYEQGAFALDDDVSVALGFSLRNPAYPNTPITYRMLLAHRSSLQDGTGYNTFLSATYAGTPPPHIQQLTSNGGTWYTPNLWRTEPPGTWFMYSNLNYGIIGTLIERLSGQRFDQFMRQQVLLPMGINGSYNIQDLDDVTDLAVLYRNNVPQADDLGGVMPVAPDLSTYTIGTNGLYFAPQGGLRASALEMARVLLFIHGQGTVQGTTVLQPDTWNTMAADAWTWNGSNGDNYFGLFRSWGLGVHRVTAQPGGDLVFPNTFMVGHAGEAYGLLSDLYFDPVTGHGLVFITNGYGPGNNYTFGTNSAFYQVEEEVFAAIATHSLPLCLSTDLSETSPPPRIIVRERHVEWTLEQPASVEVFDALGRSLQQGPLLPGKPWTPRAHHLVHLRITDHRGTTHHLTLP